MGRLPRSSGIDPSSREGVNGPIGERTGGAITVTRNARDAWSLSRLPRFIC